LADIVSATILFTKPGVGFPRNYFEKSMEANGQDDFVLGSIREKHGKK
jgi:nitrate reductase beta subunit